ncbi:MAG TPA: bifunctional homocysteine S-methyltransferase/methylenetetrahydrofolate reductase [Vicinamibacterales bacterium]|nr:bifunctional homocysteine S-methyltransferase/methylenetetrahydrofolate reductase [Vicinamibacterales bacterium]
MSGFLAALEARVLVADGAMGTMLYARGIFLNRCFDELNLSEPDLVADVHTAYMRAGADVIETNTFGANHFKLMHFGLADRVADINRAGARLARHAVRDGAFVAGSIGPLGVRIEPWGRTGVDEAEDAFRDQATALVEGGVDLFMLETFRDLNELLAAIRAVRAVSALPIVAQMSTEEDGHTLDGVPPDRFAHELEAAGANVIGVNCAVGPAAMLETVEQMARLSQLPLSAQPNAGRPRDVDGRNLYLCSPEYMASYARRFIAAGVRLVGGCCGTTPDHIRQITLAVRSAKPDDTRAGRSTPAGHAVPDTPVVVVPRAEKSGLARALAAGRFVVVPEVSSPRGLDLTGVLAEARRFAELGATAINVPDYPRSGARASALALAVQIERQAGVETLLHYSCRDRNLMGMQSDLVGAHALGLRNVLLTTGSPAPRATYPDATAVYDVDAVGLINMVVRLNHGHDVSDQPIGAPTGFHVGAAVSPFSPVPEAEWRRVAHKVEAGAEFFVTPPILDVVGFEPLFERLRQTGVPVLAGVAALESVRHAEFLVSEIPGVRVSGALLDRLRQASDERAEAFEATLEIIRWLRTRVAGIQVTSFHGSAETSERLLRRLFEDKIRPDARREAHV